MTITQSISTAPKVETEVTTPSTPHIVDRLWSGLTQPWLPIVCALLLLLTVLASLILPQLPAQLSEDPAAAARWLNNAATDYGVLGSAFSALGLFRALNSLLWRLLTLILGILLIMHLLHHWLLDRQIAQAEKILDKEMGDEITPLPLPIYPILHRERSAQEGIPDELFQHYQNRLQTEFDSLQQWQKFRQSTAEETDVQSEETATKNGENGTATTQELRLLAIKGRKELRLRMALLAGGVIAMFALWQLNITGWRIVTESLTPLERFRDDWHNVAIDFRLEDDTPIIVTQHAGVRTEMIVPLDNGTLRADSVSAVAGPPALLVQSLSPEAELKRPDGVSAVGVGLLFPAQGSEETLILPQQETVLRIVRRTDANPLAFTVEAIQARLGQTNRFEVKADETHTLTLGETEVQLRFLPLYSRKIEVLSLPRMWLLWLALPLTLLGLLGLRKKTGFALLQIAHWPDERSVVVSQGNEKLPLE